MINTRPLRILLLGIILLLFAALVNFRPNAEGLQLLIGLLGLIFCFIGGLVSDRFGAP